VVLALALQCNFRVRVGLQVFNFKFEIGYFRPGPAGQMPVALVLGPLWLQTGRHTTLKLPVVDPPQAA
jgi:hypothetical protein